jgi:outer membrane protein
MSIPRTLTAILATLALWIPSVSAVPNGESGAVRVGVVVDGPSARSDDFVAQVRSELHHLSAGSQRMVIPPDGIAKGDWTPTGIASAVDGILSRTDIDVVVTIGPGAAAAICRLETLQRPVVVPFAFGECARRCAGNGQFQVRTIDLGRMLARDLRVFHEMIDFTGVTILIPEAWPDTCGLGDPGQTIAPDGVQVRLVAVSPFTTDVSGLVPDNTEAVYLMPLHQMSDDQLRTTVEALSARGIPTFSMVGEEEVDQGVLAGVNTLATGRALARGVALDVLDTVEGRDVARSFESVFGGQLTLNMATADAIGFSPSWELLTRARVLHDDQPRRDRPITLETAMNRAVRANLDLAVADRRLAASAEDTREARAAYRPQLEVAFTGVAIDENHAIGALGQYSSSASGSVTLSQLIYSDAASGGVRIQKELQNAREHDWRSLRLDIARAAVSAYLDALRTDALVRIRQDQVDLTRTNLELARLRRSVGASGPAEIHRWEAELATARAGLLEAMAVHRASERQLSRLLAESLTTEWSLDRPDLAGALEVLGGEHQAPDLQTSEGYRRLSVELVQTALNAAPELSALDSVIAGQERVLEVAKRQNAVPTVAAQGTLSHILAKDAGGGVDLGAMADLLPQIDDTSWNVGVTASVPVLTGGRATAERNRAREELFALQSDRRSTEEKLSQRTLAALDVATASWSTIELRREAADAATKTRELVRDAYARGAASILELLDAQNNALDAELAATTALYDFLDDWAEVRRSVAGLPVDR